MFCADDLVWFAMGGWRGCNLGVVYFDRFLLLFLSLFGDMLQCRAFNYIYIYIHIYHPHVYLHRVGAVVLLFAVHWTAHGRICFVFANK